MNTFLGIELGSTRIKAVSVNEDFSTVSTGSYTWRSSYIDGIWTYDLDLAWEGIKKALSEIDDRQSIKAVGISGMMHGYLAFDKDWNLLTPFRTWQNTITSSASSVLTKLFGFHIPQRWSIAHLYQAILNGEEHVDKIAHITTLAGYIHYMLTGVNAVGVCEASGIFPIDSENLCYDAVMTEKFNDLISSHGLSLKLESLLPSVLFPGDQAGVLTEKGSELICGLLPIGTPFAPPEGDAGTGMVATNSIAVGTGNVSAGTSVFSMVVLDKPLKKVYEEIDVLATPMGKPVAMVHGNNCTSDSNAWISVMREAAELLGGTPDDNGLYTKLYQKSLEGDSDCGGVLVCNYLAGEALSGLNEGRPLVIRKAGSRFTLANFMRASLYSTVVTLKFGMDILDKEKVNVAALTAHGGLFKTPIVGQRYLAAACNTPVTVMENASEGGAYGMALLAAFSLIGNGTTLEEFLEKRVFANVSRSTLVPTEEDVCGFNRYANEFRKLLEVEKSAISVL